MVFNPILDYYPTTYKGYLIRTDFRVGIDILRTLTNTDYTEEERSVICLNLLYGSGFPTDLNLAWEGLVWFLHCGDTKNINDSCETDTSDEVIDFDFDASRIYTAILRVFGVDLTTVKDLHFFKFMYMLSDLGKETSHSKVIEYRTTKTDGMKGKELFAIKKMQKLYQIPYKLDKDTIEGMQELGLDSVDLDMYLQG